MKLKEITKKLDLRILTARDRLATEVSGGVTHRFLPPVVVNKRGGKDSGDLESTHPNFPPPLIFFVVFLF